MTRQQILNRLGELEALRLERVYQAGMDAEEYVPTDDAGRSLAVEWNALVSSLQHVAVDPEPFGKLNVPNPDFLHEELALYEASLKPRN